MDTRALPYWLLLLGLLIPDGAAAYTINETETGAHIRWGSDRVVLRLDPDFEAMLAPGEAYAAAAMAFDAWRGLPGVPDLILKADARLPPGHFGDSTSSSIHLAEQWEFEPQKLAVTVVTFDLVTGRLLDADVLVNPDAPFDLLREGRDGAEPVYDLAAVLTHEAGHVLGLGESVDDPHATMWPFANVGDIHQRSLSVDDEDGVIQAYAGVPPEPSMGCGPMTVGRRGRGPSAGWLLLALAGALLLARRRSEPLHLMGGVGLLLLMGGGTPGSDPRADHQLQSHVEALPAGPLAEQQLRSERAMQEGLLGRVEHLGTERHEGLLRTRVRIAGDDGHSVELSLPGGQLDGMVQRVVSEPLPAHGTRVRTLQDAQGVHRWVRRLP